MLFVFILLVLAICLIPIVLIDIRLKVYENQYNLAIRSLESPEDSFTTQFKTQVIQLKHSYELHKIPKRKIPMVLIKNVVKIIQSISERIISKCKSFQKQTITYVEMINKQWLKLSQLIRSKDLKTKRNVKNSSAKTK